MRIGLSSPSRSGMVSWSASKLIATAQRAPSGQAFGFMLRPARARLTMPRHFASDHCQGCSVGEVWSFMEWSPGWVRGRMVRGIAAVGNAGGVYLALIPCREAPRYADHVGPCQGAQQHPQAWAGLL